jgi:hypothetical protein
VEFLDDGFRWYANSADEEFGTGIDNDVDELV